MPSKVVVAGANIGFKVGTQSAVDGLIARGTSAGATHGTFYLTSDTHRLYIGNEDTSISAVNEGVVTVANVNSLPQTSESITGTFYYATAQNILCVYNGQDWVQINANTNTTNESNDFTTWNVPNLSNAVGVSDIIEDSEHRQVVGRFVLKGDNGITLSHSTTDVMLDGTSYEVPIITITSDTYELASTNIQGGGVNLNLNSSNTDNDSTITLLEGDSNIRIESDNNNNVTITTLNAENDSLEITGLQNGGFSVAVTDIYNKIVSDTIDPTITIGNTPQEVHFESGNATLPIYTKSETDEKFRVLNAMTYKGTLGPTGSAANTISATNTRIVLMKGSDNVQVSIGDTFLVQDDYFPTYTDPITHEVMNVTEHSLLIARSSDGTEEADGYIAPTKLTFDLVESTIDIDTTYTFELTSNGLVLKDSQGQDCGIIKIQSGTGQNPATGQDANIRVTETTSSLTSGYSKTFTLSHDTINRQDTTASTKVTANTELINPGNIAGVASTISIPVITAITTDGTGHITGITTTPYELYDTNGVVTATNTTSRYEKTNASTGVKTQTGVVQTVITTTDVYNAQTSRDVYMGISSETLNITKYDSATKTATSGDTISGLKVDMIWGSF